MVFPILGANTESATYEIQNAIRLNGADSYLKKTVGDGNRRKWTLSMWLKKTKIINNTEMYLWSSDATGAGSVHDGAGFYSFGSVTGNNGSNSFHHQLGDAHGRIVASAYARDPSSWYHMVWNVDTANGTANDRMQLYVNGSRITDVVTSNNNPNQNYDTEFNRDSTENYLFADHHYTRYYFDGYVADVAFVDGQAYDASYFGETNTNGVWVPIEPNVSSWGTNGFFLEFKQTGTSANSSGIGADTSGNDNHWTPVNLAAIDQVTDTPTNNFNILNPLANQMGGTLAEGSLRCTAVNAVDKHVFGTFGLTQGKWYFEVKVTDQGARGSIFVSDSDHNDVIGTNYAGHSFWSGGSTTSGTANSNVGSGASDNDIICFAVDLDNGQVWFSVNGDIDTSGTANITGLATSNIDRDYRVSQRETGNPRSIMEHNYGNPIYSISSSNSDANGYGNFEYAVPSGYYSLCTKNLAEYG